MQSVFDDVRSVEVNGAAVMLCLFGEFPAEPIWLLDDNEKIAFEPFHNVQATKICADLRPSENLDVSIRRVNETLPADACSISVNLLEDWFVEGHDTLQIELPRRNAPFVLTFPEKLELDGSGNPLVFEARVAAHRLIATLLLEFTDLVSGRTASENVRFDPDFQGGKNADGYQFISVPVPADMHNVSVQVSICYDGAKQANSSSEPFAFLYDVCLKAVSEGTGKPTLFDEADQRFNWLAAHMKSAPSGSTLACLFAQCGKTISVLPTDHVKNTRSFFSEDYYATKNSDLDLSLIDPFSHYLMTGWKEYRNPGPEFSVREYLLRHPDVEIAGYEPLTHYANIGLKNSYSLGIFPEKLGEIWRDSGKEIPHVPETTILERAQDMMIPMNIIDTRKLAVFVVPEHNAMSGGIYSFFSLADHVRRTRRQHGYDVLVMTRPNPQGLTYIHNSAFKNSEVVLRLEQLRLFSEVSELQIHIPEYAAVEFMRSLSPDLTRYLLRRDHVHINILNQNTRLMPEPRQFNDLRRIADSIGQSVSHHAFFGQEFANHYDLPSLLLPAYTDLTPYPPIGFAEKENLIIHSNDDAPYRRAVLGQLAAMGDYQLVKIEDMTFDAYMELATRCRFSVTFGEGFDGYVAQPMYQGGIGFALYTEEFFPDDSYKAFENFFETEDEMISQIVPTIRRLEADQARYEALNQAMRAKWDELYSYDDYVARIGKLVRKEYEVMPSGGIPVTEQSDRNG